MSDYHITPIDDLIEHTMDEDCVCAPSVKAMPESCATDWLYVHSSLDGRELEEAK